MPHTLSVFQSLWAMEGLPWRGAAPWPLEERVRRVAEAGFAGVGIDTFSPVKTPPPHVIEPLLRDAGLRVSVTVFVTETRPLAEGLRYAAEVGAELVVVCGQVFPETVDDAAVLVGSWMEEAEAAGLPMHLETHRYTLTNDLGFTARLVERVPEVRLALDLSHYVVGNELPDLDEPRVEEQIATLLAHGGSVQGRVATREQIQVPLAFPQHAPAVARFRRWWERAFAAWRERGENDDCVFLCELGTLPYPVTGPDGRELSDRWAESLVLRSWAEELFAETVPA
ncbi:sugar phosphate isomerase/epimerase [Actinocorallia herbida]|uniref:Sugar phosphate isomerase/epimerase n=1 Tax=Actinocorallia herbida TaxID=58109 RepID=A0A3N1CXP1_9ACTN|nr:TIM barrel protein [Actinocorallia herbida]ROO86063.1 sugar phosphate isomerase/epimerase [Actinocorallia herbida]